MKKIILLVASGLMLAACEPDKNTTPIVEQGTPDRPDGYVKRLFTHEGCSGPRAWGFTGEDFYYVVCDGRDATTKWNTTRHVGKTIRTESHQVSTTHK